MASERLNVTDVCDVVEFHESADGWRCMGRRGDGRRLRKEGERKWIMSRT